MCTLPNESKLFISVFLPQDSKLFLCCRVTEPEDSVTDWQNTNNIGKDHSYIPRSKLCVTKKKISLLYHFSWSKSWGEVIQNHPYNFTSLITLSKGQLEINDKIFLNRIPSPHKYWIQTWREKSEQPSKGKGEFHFKCYVVSSCYWSPINIVIVDKGKLWNFRVVCSAPLLKMGTPAAIKREVQVLLWMRFFNHSHFHLGTLCRHIFKEED